MALFHRSTREALRRIALAAVFAAALAVLSGCGGGGGSNFTHVDGYFLTPSGGLVQIPITQTSGTSTYFINMYSHAGDVSNGIKVSATAATSFPTPYPTGYVLAMDGGYQVESTLGGATIKNLITISLGYDPKLPSQLSTSEISTLRIFELRSGAWTPLPNYYVYNPGSTTYPSDPSFTTLPNTVTAQFLQFDTTGTTGFAVLYQPDNNTTPTLDPYFGTYKIAFTASSGTSPAFVYVDAAGSKDANGKYDLTANGANASIPVTGTIDPATGQVANFTITEGGVTYTLTGTFTTNPLAGSGSYTATGTLGKWAATIL